MNTWHNPHLPGTVFLRVEYREQRFERHFHEEYAIGVIDTGCQAFEYDKSRRLDMPARSVSLIAPGVVHSGWPGSEHGWSYRMMYPEASLVSWALQDIIGRESAPATFHRSVVSDPLLYARLARLHQLSADPYADALEVEALYLAVIRDAFTRHAGTLLVPDPARHAPAMTRAFKGTLGFTPGMLVKSIRPTAISFKK